MDDANRAEIELITICGDRRKPWYNMCRGTSRQGFIAQMKTWLGGEFPQNYTAFFYHKKLTKMIRLDNNERCYLAPIFDLISFESQAVGVQPLSTNDRPYVKLYISTEDSSISSGLSSKAFAGNVSFKNFHKLAKY